MIEQIRVIRCDALVHLPARPPRLGKGPSDGAARTVQCTRFLPIRHDPITAWEAALRRGWSQVFDRDTQPRQLCPDCTTAHTSKPRDFAVPASV